MIYSNQMPKIAIARGKSANMRYTSFSAIPVADLSASFWGNSHSHYQYITMENHHDITCVHDIMGMYIGYNDGT